MRAIAVPSPRAWLCNKKLNGRFNSTSSIRNHGADTRIIARMDPSGRSTAASNVWLFVLTPLTRTERGRPKNTVVHARGALSAGDLRSARSHQAQLYDALNVHLPSLGCPLGYLEMDAGAASAPAFLRPVPRRCCAPLASDVGQELPRLATDVDHRQLPTREGVPAVRPMRNRATGAIIG